MELFFRCSCGKFEQATNANYASTEDANKEENPLCWDCFDGRQDAKAFHESGGIFRNFEDWMEDKGATIIDDSHYIIREY
ncbi:hypothetical protein M5X02_30155 [Paenibacillus alvei]|uniref:hypothetical protein n=1 Tax=Paenibacillus alvei TaxID=44250 RepID=UPI0002894A58|nr:hypothetical protein [Paenibacillus alvei]EJW14054.1 hypothetical protein PAV_141p01600 [Paenibacillus alvei DSM 29]MCY9544893.1 hypothetical protein [Paenibacillus alvei]MCY9707794.1 hypothetical protein [Paenibacillus alvei]MEC0082694.1 hypothetical protein [Paenibacillus alvei]